MKEKIIKSGMNNEYMYNFIYKKLLLKICLMCYENNIETYLDEILKHSKTFEKVSEELPKDALDKTIFLANIDATQAYYRVVFDAVCNRLSSINERFKLLLPLKIISPSGCGYHFDIDNLAAGTIYAFAFWVITDKKAPAKKCTYINHYVHDLKNSALKNLLN